LSEVDIGVKHSLDTICDAVELLAVRGQILSRRWTVKQFSTDMLLLERWCLKTLINFNVSQAHGLAIDSTAREPRRPTKELVRVALGIQRFVDSKGLYVVVRNDQKITMDEGTFNVTTKTDGVKLVGAELSLWGMPFFLSLLSEPVTFSGVTLMRRRMKYAFNTWDQKRRPVPSHFINFMYRED
jgi:hypothetical protein